MKQKNDLRWDGDRLVPHLRAESEMYLRKMLTYLGNDVDSESIKDTPMRFVAMLEDMHNPKAFKFTTFKADCDQMIVVDNIPFYSLCEHHIVPFFGVAHVAYIPHKRIVGLSKLPRTVEFFSAGLRTQEGITSAVADFIFKHDDLKPRGVGVALHARHLCMEMRGVKKPGAMTRTSALRGNFLNEKGVKEEFFSLLI